MEKQNGSGVTTGAACLSNTTARDLIALFFHDDMSDDLTESIGISGIRFYDLAAGRRSYCLDYEDILEFKGNTSVYLQYTYSRFYSICMTSTTCYHVQSLQTCVDSVHICSEKERDILFQLSRFDEVLDLAAESYSPNILCDYIISVARSANVFYESSRIIGSKQEDSKIQICHFILQILSRSMKLLGIKILEKM